MPNSPRLIEDYLPIEAISKEVLREKNVWKGHISMLHLCWADVLDHAKRETMAARFYDIPAEAIGQARRMESGA